MNSKMLLDKKKIYDDKIMQLRYFRIITTIHLMIVWYIVRIHMNQTSEGTLRLS